MPHRKPTRLSSNLTRIDTPSEIAPPVVGAPPRGGGSGWIVIAAVVILLFAIARCSSSTPNQSTPTALVGTAQESLASAVEKQSPPPPEPLARTGARKGAARVALVDVEGLAGEMVFSQNCYDMLGHDFSWRKLDECGGFDARASSQLPEETAAGDEKAAAWFDGEASAGRYLKAAIAAGLPADQADTRLAALQAIAAPTTRRADVRSVEPVEDEEEPGAEVPTGGAEDAPVNVDV